MVLPSGLKAKHTIGSDFPDKVLTAEKFDQEVGGRWVKGDGLLNF
jgi:hypothetical protein